MAQAPAPAGAVCQVREPSPAGEGKVRAVCQELEPARQSPDRQAAVGLRLTPLILAAKERAKVAEIPSASLNQMSHRDEMLVVGRSFSTNRSCHFTKGKEF